MLMKEFLVHTCLILLWQCPSSRRIGEDFRSSHISGGTVSEINIEVRVSGASRSLKATGAHRLSWQGNVESLQGSKHKFAPEDVHREFLFTADNTYKSVYLGTSSMCGVDLFTTSEQQCAEMKRADFDDYLKLLKPMTERGFGVEMELFGRERQSFELMDLISSRVGLLKACYKQKIRFFLEASGDECNNNSQCSRGEYCRKPHGNTFKADMRENYCKPDFKCEPDKSVDGVCPGKHVSPLKWSWTSDPTVKALTIEQAGFALADKATAQAIKSEITGIGFELISPILSGVYGAISVIETLGVLRELGIQAGPSQSLHVHVNVGRCGGYGCDSHAAGSILDAAQIFNVWAHYVRFQFVIDEMLQDSRIGNQWALPMALGKQERYLNWMSTPTKASASKAFSLTPLWVKQIFENMQGWLVKNKEKRELSHCDVILDGLGEMGRRLPDVMPRIGETVCISRYPPERYFQINLAALNRLGTIEFRAFPATTDPERAHQWIAFIVNFVEHYKDDGRFLPAKWKSRVSKILRARSVNDLVNAQQEASLALMKDEMTSSGKQVNFRYWEKRSWLAKSKACSMPSALAEESEEEEVTRLQGLMASGVVKEPEIIIDE